MTTKLPVPPGTRAAEASEAAPAVIACKDCKWLQGYCTCSHASAYTRTGVDFVTGRFKGYFADANAHRSGNYANACGPSAVFFERRIPGLLDWWQV